MNPYFATSRLSLSHSSAAGSSKIRRRQADGPRPGRRLDPELGPAHALEGRPGERTVVGQRAAALGEREDRRSLAAAGPARSDPDAARIVDGRVTRLGGHPAGVELDSRAEASGSTSAASGATVALARVRRVAGDTGKTAVGVPAAAQTTG